MNLTKWLFISSKYLNKEAILTNSETLMYPQIFNYANKISFFIASKFEKGNIIAILSHNSFFFIASYLGVVKSGCIAFLLDPKSSKEELEQYISKSGANCILSENRLLTKLKNTQNNVISETTISLITEEKPIFDFTDKYIGEGDSPAVIMLTSGSSSNKKMVLLSHKNIISNTKSIINYLKLNENDRICVVLPFHYCYGTSLLHSHIHVGGSLFLHNSIFIGTVTKEINEYNCTGFAGVPTTFFILQNKTKFLDNKYIDLRYITQAGGKLASSILKKIKIKIPYVDIYVMYGQTEASARLSYLPPELLLKKIDSIGKGIPGVELKVIDDNNKPVDIGSVGELIAKGENIMLGYLNDEKATKQKLKNGFLHTGDLAKVDRDGFIYIIGRKDDLIKTAGHRVSPYEIESIIITFPGVIACAIVGLEDNLLGESLVAYVVIKSDYDLKEEIFKMCKKKLVSYKQPKHIKIIKSLPINSNMKVDRNILKEKARQEFIRNESGLL